jgi:hypothetical protein
MNPPPSESVCHPLNLRANQRAGKAAAGSIDYDLMNRSREFGFPEIDDVELIHFQGGLFLRPPLCVGTLKLVQEFCSAPTAAESALPLWPSGFSGRPEFIAKQRRIQVADIAYLWYFMQGLKSREKQA